MSFSSSLCKQPRVMQKCGGTDTDVREVGVSVGDDKSVSQVCELSVNVPRSRSPEPLG